MDKRLLLVLILVTVISTITGIVTVAYSFHPLFLQDSWEMVGLFQRSLGAGVGFAELWAQHNEHRILIPKLILWADLLWENGSGFFVLLLMLLLQAVHVGLIAQLLGGDPRFDATTRTFFVCVAAILFFWLRQSENFVWTFQIAWILNALVVSIAAYLLARLDEQQDGRPAPVLSTVILAGLACFVATTTLASGLLLPAVLGVVLWKARVPRAIWVGWLLFSSLLFATYLLGYTSPAHHPKPSEALAFDTLLYLLAYLGNPVTLSGILIHLKLIAGTVILGSYLWLAQDFLRGASPPLLERFAFVVSTQAMLMAGLTAVGRHTMGLEQAASGRYSTPVLILWFTLAIWVFALAVDRPRLRCWELRALVVFLLCFVLPKQFLLVPKTTALYVIHDEVSLALMSGVGDTAATNRAYPDTERLWALNEVARANALSFYREEWTRWPRAGLSSAVAIDSTYGVRAAISERRSVGTPERPGFRIHGRLESATEDSRIPHLDFVLTRGDSIVGYARGERRACTGCFTGYVGGSADFATHAVTRDGTGIQRATFIPMTGSARRPDGS